MKKRYYVAERVIGVYFKDTLQAFRYFERLVKHYYDGYNIGPVKELKTKEELENHVKNHDIKTIWRESTI